MEQHDLELAEDALDPRRVLVRDLVVKDELRPSLSKRRSGRIAEVRTVRGCDDLKAHQDSESLTQTNRSGPHLRVPETTE
jgi:hypothetical protein